MLALAIAVRISIMTTGVRILLVGTILFGLFCGVPAFAQAAGNHIPPPGLSGNLLPCARDSLERGGENKPYNVDALRAAYIKRLGAFDGVRFVWGGKPPTASTAPGWRGSGCGRRCSGRDSGN